MLRGEVQRRMPGSDARGIPGRPDEAHPGTREERPLRPRWRRLQPYGRPHYEGRRTLRHRDEHAPGHDSDIAPAATGSLRRHHVQPID